MGRWGSSSVHRWRFWEDISWAKVLACRGLALGSYDWIRGEIDCGTWDCRLGRCLVKYRGMEVWEDDVWLDGMVVSMGVGDWGGEAMFSEGA